MKLKTLNHCFPFAAAAALIGVLGSFPALATGNRNQAAGQIINETGLPATRVTDMFLRENVAGRVFLYIASRNHTISVFDVTNPREPRETDELSVTQNRPVFHVRPLNAEAVIGTAAPDPSQQLTVLDENAVGRSDITKQFANVDAYTIDSGRNLIYIADKSKLSILEFSRPLTREAEIWEQWYESR